MITWTLGGIGAGGDTSVNVIRALYHNLLTHPATLNELKSEINESSKGKDEGRQLSWQEAKNLPYFSACLLEAARIHPSIGLPLERIVPEGGTSLSGMCLPPGTIVGANAWVINRDLEVFGPDADAWNPSRWLVNDSAARVKMTQTLFSVSKTLYPPWLVSNLRIGADLGTNSSEGDIARALGEIYLK